MVVVVVVQPQKATSTEGGRVDEGVGVEGTGGSGGGGVGGIIIVFRAFYFPLIALRGQSVGRAEGWLVLHTWGGLGAGHWLIVWRQHI